MGIRNYKISCVNGKEFYLNYDRDEFKALMGETDKMIKIKGTGTFIRVNQIVSFTDLTPKARKVEVSTIEEL